MMASERGERISASAIAETVAGVPLLPSDAPTSASEGGVDSTAPAMSFEASEPARGGEDTRLSA